MQIKLPNLKFYWRKGEKPFSSDMIYINGKTLAFIGLSIISGFINLVFISNLTKSPYIIGWLQQKNAAWIAIPGAAFLGIMSIFLDISKCLHAIQINTLSELQRKLSNKQDIVKKLQRVKIKWFIVYVLYIFISIATSMSLSVTSIGGAIRENENIITLITEDYNELALLKDNQKSDKSDKRDITRSNITGTQTAKEAAEKEVATYWGYIEDYRIQRDAIENQPLTEDFTEETQKAQIDALRTKVVQRVPVVTARNVDYISQTEFKKKMQDISKVSETDTSNAKVLEDLINENSEEIVQAIRGLEGRYVDTLGNPVTFLNEDGTPVDITTALSTLKTLKNKYQSDGNSEIGLSAKGFTILADAINSHRKRPNTSGFGTTEILMMAVILFLSLLVELGINQFSTKTKISRKLLGQFSQYLPKNFDTNDFMIDIYMDQFNFGAITKEERDAKIKECVEARQDTKAKLIAKFSEAIESPEPAAVEKIVQTVENEELAELRQQVALLLKQNDENSKELADLRIKNADLENEINKPAPKVVHREENNELNDALRELKNTLKGDK